MTDAASAQRPQQLQPLAPRDFDGLAPSGQVRAAVCPACGDVSTRPRTAELELLEVETAR